MQYIKKRIVNWQCKTDLTIRGRGPTCYTIKVQNTAWHVRSELNHCILF